MPTDEQALDRADRVANRLGIAGQPVRHGDGWSNQVWFYDDAVIRVSARPGPGTLAREAKLAPRLPAAVGYPQILGSGVIDGHDWMAQDRLPGDNLADTWTSLDPDQRAFAVADLCRRLDAVPSADLTGLRLPPTPLYALAAELVDRQLAIARSIVGVTVAARAGDLVRAGLDATTLIPAGLVHTDAVLTNVIWTGAAAVPVDFEFACVGPIDLDVDCVGREVLSRDDPAAIDRLRDVLKPTLDRPGAVERLRGYSVLRHLWAIGKWVENDPALTDAADWEPVRALIADIEQSGWVDRLLHARR